MADQCTMAELQRAPTDGYAEAIVVPPILAEQFEDRYKDLLRAFAHHGFNELHQLDTFYNALNPADQDSLNSAAGGNLLERRTQDVLMIIENKSKVRNSRKKSIVSQLKSIDVNSSSSSEIAKLTHAVNQKTSVVTPAMTAILKQFQATLPSASVKAVEEICVTCNGTHPYYQCLAVEGNAFTELQDNIQGYVAAAAVNYNHGAACDGSKKNPRDRYKDLLRAFAHHGFNELHQLDTFYNALNPADQDSLNSAAGGNLLERRTQDVLMIIENKSKVRNSRNKSIVSQLKSIDVNSSSSFEIAKLTHAVNQKTSVVTPAMTAILKQFQATPPSASVKAVEEICVTCNGTHPYYQCLAVEGNAFTELQDNIQGYVAAAAVNYNQEYDGYLFPNEHCFYFGLGPLSSNTIAKPKGELKAITTQSGIVLDGPSIPIPSPFINPKEDERVEETLTDQDLAEYTIKVPPPFVQKPKPHSQRNFVVHQRDPLHPNIPYPLRMHKQKQQEKDESPLILGRPFLRTARALIDVHGEEMILCDGYRRLTLNMRHDTSSYSSQPKKESINMINIYDDSKYDGYLFPNEHCFYFGLGPLPSNTIAKPKGELKSITTQSGIVLDGPSIPIPSLFINPKEDERVEETLTDQDLAEYTIKLHINITLADALILIPEYQKILKALISNKEKLLELGNIPLNENCSAVILKKLCKKLRDLWEISHSVWF
nr:reverse transcriptase domain-containing protein [Tanacetum cinerariifolium]